MNMTPRLSISVVLPAYNEEGNLSGTLAELLNELVSVASDYEVLIVNDGSTDRTADVAKALAEEHRCIRVLHHTRNRGYGAALRTGFAAASMPWILLIDADGQFDPADLPAFVAMAEVTDFVIGYRLARADPVHRVWYARAWRMLMRGLIGLRVRDVDCAFKLMRTSLVQSLDLESEGAFISAEALAKAVRAGARIVELPVQHRARRHGRSTGGHPSILLRAFYELFRLSRRVRHFDDSAAVKAALAAKRSALR